MSKKISELTAVTDVTPSDLFQVVDVEDPAMASSGTNKKVTAQTLGNYLPVRALGAPTSRTLSERFGDTANVKDFGAAGDGIQDDTAAFQAAVKASLNVTVPAGTYKITGSILCQTAVNIIGSGRGVTKIVASGSTDIFVWMNTVSVGTMIMGAGLFNLTILGTGKTAGNAIKAYRVERFNVRNVSIAGGYTGIYIESQNVASIQNVWLNGLTGEYAIKNYGSNAYKADVLDLDDVQIGFASTNTTSTGIMIDSGVDTIDIRHVAVVRGYRGLSITNTDSFPSSPALCNAYDFQTDFTHAEGIYIDGGGGASRAHQFTDCYVQGSQTECGIKITESAQYVTIKSGQITSNFKQGILVNGRYVKIIGCQISTNSRAGSNLYAAVEFGPTSGSQGNSIIGCTCGIWSGYATELTSYGVLIGVNHSDYTIIGNTFSGSVSGDYMDNSNHPRSVIFGNAQSATTNNKIGSPIVSNSGQDLTLLGSTTNRVSLGNIQNGIAFQAQAEDTASVNILTAISKAAGSSPRIQCDGSDANIDLRLAPKGTGRVQYGTHQTSAGGTITGYIEIKDIAGNVRKLAVIA